MNSIILIATGHKENGNCSSDELYKIIEYLNPDLIFEELSTYYSSLIYEGRLNDSLETASIKRYLQKKEVTHLPVDIDSFDGKQLIDRYFKAEIVKMFDTFDQSPDYYNLGVQHNFLSNEKGFKYLNSDECKTLLERMRVLELMILRIKNDQKLFNVYHDWSAIHDIRENAMIKNINDYSATNRFDKAIFLVGARHRKAIIDKISVLDQAGDITLNWNFNYFND
jgi:hypothetical protein